MKLFYCAKKQQQYFLNKRCIILKVSKKKNVSLPGHSLILQLSVSIFGPMHVFPPWAGAGLLHLRDRSFKPSPHVLEHTPNFDHSEYPPSTIKKMYIKH